VRILLASAGLWPIAALAAAPLKVIVRSRWIQLADLGGAGEGLLCGQRHVDRVDADPSSVFQLTGLIDGKFDIAINAIDNLIAYREGQGEEPRVGPDLVAVMGGDSRCWANIRASSRACASRGLKRIATR
jgi:hypothetical protein